MELQTVYCLSTAHITRRDDELMTSDSFLQPIFNARHNYGYFVYIPQSDNGVTDLIRDCRRFGYSESVVKVLRLGATLKARYMHFDCDGPIWAKQVEQGLLDENEW